MEVERYPGFRYHRTEAPKIVNSLEEDQALGEGWEHSPAAFDAPPSESESPVDEAPVKPEPADPAPARRRR